MDLLATVGLADRAETYPPTLSSGEMKRVAIARALMNSPSLLIADEPTGDLDVDTEDEIMQVFGRLNRDGTTVVMVTHNPDLARYATRMFRMDRGRLEERTGIHAGPSLRESLPV
jgi:putative ABC transport system ATP-binding protein